MQNRGFIFWSTCSFTLLMVVLQMVRPVKDDSALMAGLEILPLLMLLSFVLLIVFSALLFHVNGKSGFYLLSVLFVFIFPISHYLNGPLEASLIYVLISSISLVILTQFWRALSECEGKSESHVAFIIAYGSVGAILGSILVVTLVASGFKDYLPLILNGLIVMAAASFSIAMSYAGDKVRMKTPDSYRRFDKTRYGSFLLLYSLVATYLYYQQLDIISRYENFIEPQIVFGFRDLLISLLTLAVHHLLVKQNIKIEKHVTAIPVITASLFLLIFLSPSLIPILFAVVVFRTGNFTITKPSRELYYSIKPGMNKYKGFLDAAIYRSGDMLGALLFAGLNSLGIGLAFKSLAIIPLVAVWYYTSKKVSVILK
ncbi:hypothetical protein [Fulvivirga lutea]|uniref:MFS transporter n=1 Tax=Fulvivirga lutea TaxID=2810512 RepID=A0A975A0F1_9BACT|nr:hypothetical protein [Fulvivirga lutea]QSE97329.1 hypothetical protein JR347_17365 [Fulvivirga lutea]